MKTDPPNPPAFPVPPGATTFTGDPRDGGGYEPAQEGMTLRDYFAAAALQGLIASGPHDISLREYSLESYQHADAMLAARQPERSAE
jgi:hypothetical protein